MATNVYSRTLQKAAILLGSRAALCKRLQVPMEELRRWIEEEAVPPIAVFLQAVDLVLEETSAGEEADSGGEAPRDCAGPGDTPVALG